MGQLTTRAAGVVLYWAVYGGIIYTLKIYN